MERHGHQQHAAGIRELGRCAHGHIIDPALADHPTAPLPRQRMGSRGTTTGMRSLDYDSLKLNPITDSHDRAPCLKMLCRLAIKGHQVAKRLLRCVVDDKLIKLELTAPRL